MSESVMLQSLREFMLIYNVRGHSKCIAALGIGSTTDTEQGFCFYFETAKDMEQFPYKDPAYKGVPIYKYVTGKIQPLNL